MRRLQPSDVMPAVIIAAVVAMLVYANVRDIGESREMMAQRPRATRHSLVTSRDQLDQQIQTLTARVAGNPDDLPSAVQLADALLRQTRITGNTGLALQAESILRSALGQQSGNYEATRMLATV